MLTDFTELSTAVGHVLHKKKWKLVTAESCTGGLVAEVMTSIPGASAWFDRGFVTYSRESKHEMLGVPQSMIEQEGVVSGAVVKAMAEGALKNSHAQVSIATTGIAGPNGGSEKNKVGTVWFGWSIMGLPTQTERRVFDGDRKSVRIQAVQYVLIRLLEYFLKK